MKLTSEQRDSRILVIYLRIIKFFAISLILGSQARPQSNDLSTKSPDKDTITIAAVGDIMLGSNFPSEAFLPPDDGATLLAPVREFLGNTDITFGNSEGTFLDSGGILKKVENPKNLFAFRQPRRYAKYLVDAGFTLVNIANNHSGDFGDRGRISTTETLDSVGLYYAGLIDKPYTIFKKGGIKYGFCGFAPNSGTADIRDIEQARRIVSMLDSVCDVVIVSFHGGAEGEGHTHVKKTTEIYLGENRGDVYRFAHAVIDAGADVVFGHGPHVTRAIELYKDRFIAYSLGNFCTFGQFELSGKCGIAPIVRLHIDRTGKFLDGRIIPIKQVGDGGPIPDPDSAAIKEIQKLTRSDFPSTPLTINDAGMILRKKELPESFYNKAR